MRARNYDRLLGLLGGAIFGVARRRRWARAEGTALYLRCIPIETLIGGSSISDDDRPRGRASGVLPTGSDCRRKCLKGIDPLHLLWAGKPTSFPLGAMKTAGFLMVR
jgi:hypothetical protein